MHLTLSMPTNLLDAVYIPECVKKLDNLKLLLNNRGTFKECFYLLKYAYTRSAYEGHFSFTHLGEMMFPLFNKGVPLFAKCTPYRGSYDKPNQRFKLCSFLQEKKFVQRKNNRPQIIDNFLNVDALSMELGTFHTLCGHNRTHICGENYRDRTQILVECVERSIRYAQVQTSVIKVDYYDGHQQLMLPYLDHESRIQTNLVLVVRFENGKWVIPTVLPRKYVESNKKLRLN